MLDEPESWDPSNCTSSLRWLYVRPSTVTHRHEQSTNACNEAMRYAWLLSCWFGIRSSSKSSNTAFSSLRTTHIKASIETDPVTSNDFVTQESVNQLWRDMGEEASGCDGLCEWFDYWEAPCVMVHPWSEGLGHIRSHDNDQWAFFFWIQESTRD